MRIAVLNASGIQAKAIADHLGTAHAVTRLSRAAGPGLTTVESESEDDLARKLEGQDAVVLTSPIDHRPGSREAYADRVTRAAERAGLSRVVLNTAAAVLDSDRPVATVLKRVRDIVQSGAVPSTVVQPTVYLDNLLAPWFLPAILNDGVVAYPIAPDTAVSWISHADLARFIAAVLARSETAGRVFDIGGEALTGPELTAVVERAVGRPVAYQKLPFEPFAAGLNAGFGAPTGDDIADMYRHLQQNPEALLRDDSAWSELGLAPATAAKWAAGQTWVPS
jgi:NAD(P)H dehydrogenase (quinone)